MEGHQDPILMGDFNSGPASSQTTWKSPFFYGLIATRGFVSPFFSLDGRCTSCADNTLQVLTGNAGNFLPDHIFTTTAVSNKVKSVKVYVQGMIQPFQLIINELSITFSFHHHIMFIVTNHAQRLYDDVFTESGTPLSDHYGIEIVVEGSSSGSDVNDSPKLSSTILE